MEEGEEEMVVERMKEEEEEKVNRRWRRSSNDFDEGKRSGHMMQTHAVSHSIKVYAVDVQFPLNM